MKDLLEISSLSKKTIEKLVERAFLFKQGTYPKAYGNTPMVHLFYEHSTRTRVSFERAAQMLQMPVIGMDVALSSENKGEHIEDTVRTLAAMGLSIFVVRHKQEGVPKVLANLPGLNIHVVNAGDGKHAHPSQSLIDLMTIIELKKDIKKLKIAVVGDISHSRVANSFEVLCQIMGIDDLVLVAPKIWHPNFIHHGRLTTSLQEGLEEADVVMCLRIQKERLLEQEQMDLVTYRQAYAITAEHLKMAKPNAIIMHPGPMNRGLEIDSEVADGPHSAILKQVNNSVFMRMAILEALIEG